MPALSQHLGRQHLGRQHLGRQLRGCIGGSIIHNQYLPVSTGRLTLEHVLEAGADVGGLVVGRDHHRQRGVLRTGGCDRPQHRSAGKATHQPQLKQQETAAGCRGRYQQQQSDELLPMGTQNNQRPASMIGLMNNTMTP